ncbi:MAG: histidine triad nucleotide-binding protein [Anaerolineales bacterium]|nr:histidine triad nucleotide-binding protein [Anaerolineales bacterium]
MTSCVFCKIVASQSPAEIVHQDNRVTAFRDFQPVAPTHILIVPNRHIESVNNLESGDEALIGYMFSVAKELAARENIHENGYRLIINTGVDGGQSVFHLHLHLLGGQHMRNPIG